MIFDNHAHTEYADYKSAALPLSQVGKIDGAYRARTCDPLLVRQMLSQLS